MAFLDRETRPFVLLGILSMLFAGFAALFYLSTAPSLEWLQRRAFVYFTIANVAFYLSLGMGLVLRTRWGYVLLKVFLYLGLLAFPIGTGVSLLTLSYLKTRGVKRHFGFHPSPEFTGPTAIPRRTKAVAATLIIGSVALSACMMLFL